MIKTLTSEVVFWRELNEMSFEDNNNEHTLYTINLNKSQEMSLKMQEDDICVELKYVS